ncbi:hypothetical protein [Paenibacillus alba]|uniref:Uncharacterized protein n=1 Tax=Paenibacillus alba TaxID=1197127 RepID=A0ABU6GAF5_9BACL|nr:hypothetical protein [Paenibacillus alba]MEC0231183.1 hypothetical protein [Paenibacillus alba]
MPTVDFGRMDGDATFEDLLEAFAKVQKMLDYLMQGGLDSKNAREFGGWLVGLTELQARDKTVGMSTESTPADDIRFWAGDLKKGAPNFKVTESGILTAVAAVIMSAAGYPKVTLNQNSNLLQAFSDALNHVDFTPNAGTAPGLSWYVDGVLKAYFQTTTGGPLLTSFGSAGITLQPAEDLNLLITGGNIKVNGTPAFSGPVYYVKNVLPDGSGGYYGAYGTMNFSKGILTSVS